MLLGLIWEGTMGRSCVERAWRVEVKSMEEMGDVDVRCLEELDHVIDR